MQSPTQFPLLFFSFFMFFSLSLSDPRITEAGLFCGTVNAARSNFISEFVAVMESLSEQVNRAGWGTHVNGSVYGLAQCLSDLSHTDCLFCFAQARTKLPHCLPAIAARIFLDGCFLRYDNYSFFTEPLDPQHDTAVCGQQAVEGEPDRSQLAKNVRTIVKNVTEIAVKDGGFGVGEIGNVYGLAQCWKTIENVGCRKCLENASREVVECLPENEGKRLSAGCYLRYSTEKFYDDVEKDIGNLDGEATEDGRPRIGIIAAISSSVAIVALLSILGVFIGYGGLSKRRKARKRLGQLSVVVGRSNLHFKYELLEKATNFFDPLRKLGQGGAGSVYKGILPDGRIVAVKRLFFNTRQWVDEFFNEVNLISGVHHENLVQLLGCSIEGPESLLVYEYVPNKSLDHFLFKKKKTQSLSWQQRFDVIVGTAKGLAYLHDGTGTRIIHRDIKTSNILLDENLRAKIADFGLARCFSADQTHLSTGIAGTLGYMAPEYLVRGQLTEKADVYSFGVLVLEIVCGRKNSVYVEESSSILQMVWKHYQSNTLPESVDEYLKDHFPAKEASNVLQIGLLCTQASVSLRPSMSEVVKMLTETDYPIPLPMQPPFLNASSADTNATSISASFPSSESQATSNVLLTPASEPR
ncbi:cysteine-rich receptor-like protein kinase 42 isoform X2 [Magnolia sinica]|uniref:cysteine-rich receptor-like protein kinase 42 isoform X2 n=1 Tax=Magnolia sinica TaxID=86752 RepID=UPI00265A34C1|nr:cysteine-rich receptor-like protein kinase 42 isoform X2 [Magnolia sinica]